MTYILRRRKLGRTSCREITRLSKTGIRLFRNDDRHLPNDPNELCIRWGCTSEVASKTVLNRSQAIHQAADKAGYRRLLSPKNLCPKTYFTREELPDLNGEHDHSLIFRPRNHHQGRHLYVVERPEEVDGAIRKCGPGWYASEYINKVAEYRVFIVSGRCVAVAQKTPANPQAVAWNVAQGGRFDNVKWDEWPLKAVKVSIEAFNLSGLDFGGVDIMVDAKGGVFVLEINSAPSLTSPYRQECMAKAFDYISVHGKNMIPLTDDRGGYKKFIHPAICADAIMRPAD